MLIRWQAPPRAFAMRAILGRAMLAQRVLRDPIRRTLVPRLAAFAKLANIPTNKARWRASNAPSTRLQFLEPPSVCAILDTRELVPRALPALLGGGEDGAISTSAAGIFSTAALKVVVVALVFGPPPFDAPRLVPPPFAAGFEEDAAAASFAPAAAFGMVDNFEASAVMPVADATGFAGLAGIFGGMLSTYAGN